MNQAHYDIDMSPDTRSEAPDAAASVTFQCSACGECCSSILIHIEREKLQALEQREWFTQRLREFNARVLPWNDTHALLPHKPDKTCVFLNEDKHCLIERHEGKDLKPDECKHFPFAGIRLDDGTRLYDCSAACKHVAEDLLLSYKTILPETQWGETLPVQPAPKNVRLTPWRSLDWDTYQERLLQIKEIFQQSASVESAMSRAKRLMLSGKVPKEAPLVSWPYWFQQLVLLAFLRKPYNSYSAFTLLQREQYEDPYIFGKGPVGGIRLLNSDMAFSDEADALLKAFAFNILNRYVLLSHGHWFSDVFTIACVAVVLARWYACALAGMDSRRDVSRHDMAFAIRLTERYYTGHQPRFLAFFRQKLLGIHLGYCLQRLI